MYLTAIQVELDGDIESISVINCYFSVYVGNTVENGWRNMSFMTIDIFLLIFCCWNELWAGHWCWSWWIAGIIFTFFFRLWLEFVCCLLSPACLLCLHPFWPLPEPIVRDFLSGFFLCRVDGRVNIVVSGA